MALTRRTFIAGTAACAGTICTGCVVINPAPTFDALADGSIPMPESLAKPGAEIKVRLVGVDEPVLVWRAEDGLHAASVVCTHRGCEVSYNPPGGSLDCPCHGSRFAKDGAVLQGPAKTPLKSYRVEVKGNILRVSSKL